MENLNSVKQSTKEGLDLLRKNIHDWDYEKKIIIKSSINTLINESFPDRWMRLYRKLITSSLNFCEEKMNSETELNPIEEKDFFQTSIPLLKRILELTEEYKKPEKIQGLIIPILESTLSMIENSGAKNPSV